MVKWKKKNKFKPVSYQVRNNTETTLHINDYKFHIPENEEITKIDWRIDSYKI